MRSGDEKDVGAVSRKRPAADWTGDDAGQVENLDAGERPRRRFELLRRRIADFLDAEQWRLRDGAALRVPIPLGEGSARRNDEPGIGGGGFKRLRPPAGQCALHRCLIVIAAEELKKTAAMMRQIGVKPRPAAVAAAVKPGYPVMMIFRRLTVDLQVTLAAEFDRCVAHVDTHALAATGSLPPQRRGRERSRADCRLRRCPDRE